MGELFLDRYEVVQYLGHGSMGQVYLARPVDAANARVVVKLMHDHVANQPRFRQLFQREIQSMRGLSHPYIVRLLDASGEGAEKPCLVMEYIPGVPLESLLNSEIRLSPQRTGVLLGYLCHALQSAHEMGVVHRDLKPANLMVVHRGTEHEALRVMDFGLSKMTSKPHLTAERLAGTGGLSAQGTPNYICPDQLRGDEIDGRADIYSVGVMLYEMLTGELPFAYDQPQQLLAAHLHQRPDPFLMRGIDTVPPEVEAVVMACLAKYPNERPQTARELALAFGAALREDIWQWAEPGPTQERPPTPSDPALPEPPAGGNWAGRFQAWMPERIAVVKLGGFIQDLGGRVLETEPGLLRVQIGEADPGGWMVKLGLRKRAHDPILIEFAMSKPNPKENRIEVAVRFGVPRGYRLADPARWQESCQVLLREIQAYLVVNN